MVPAKTACVRVRPPQPPAPLRSGSARASRATKTLPPRSPAIAASAIRLSSAKPGHVFRRRRSRPFHLGRRLRLELANLVQDRAATACRFLVVLDRVELGARQTAEPLNHLRCGQRVVARNGQRVGARVADRCWTATAAADGVVAAEVARCRRRGAQAVGRRGWRRRAARLPTTSPACSTAFSASLRPWAMANSVITLAVPTCLVTSSRPISIQPGSMLRMKLANPIGAYTTSSTAFSTGDLSSLT